MVESTLMPQTTNCLADGSDERGVGNAPECGDSSRIRGITNRCFRTAFEEYRRRPLTSPLLLHGYAKEVLAEMPSSSIDCVMTSPPYWGKREYENGGIGMESTCDSYVQALEQVFVEVKRILKPSGSFWLNIGDRYVNKGLAGVPWRVAFMLTDRQGWVTRNSVVWNKVKSGMDNTTDRLGNIHETVFHFVKQPKGYYYNVDNIRTTPRKARVENGAIISATGVSGVRYRRQIEMSVELSSAEKIAALSALDEMLNEIRCGKITDFRMIIRNQQRTTHSNSQRVSGRAKELRDKGFYFIRCHPKGSKPSDVWDILPEDTHNRSSHPSPYPSDLCRIPILATCPPEGIVLDPFCGTGTTLLVANDLERKSVGVDCSREYLEYAESRCARLI